LATHNPLSGSLGTIRAALFQTKLSLYTTYVLGAHLPPGSVADALFWDTSDPYEYLRIEPRKDHQLVIFGGADAKTGQASDEHAFEALERRLHARLPAAQVRRRWLGQVIETDDGLPFIGEHAPGEFIATGFAGNGYTLGTLAAMMARDAFLGRTNPWAELLRVERKPFHGGLLGYVRENLDYPRYLLGDRLGGAHEWDLDHVPVGEGRIVALDAGKCAVYRGEDGQLSIHSAVCTHMKCLVRWNGAAGTWDCPCHGSRFSTRGEVLAGPAQHPLPPVEPGPADKRSASASGWQGAPRMPARDSRRAADVLVETLLDWGVDTLFGLPGDGINGIIEALRTRQERIRFIQVRHEQAAAFMACAYAKWTGRLGVCLATTGPGGI